MSVKPEIELTADGSHTLFVPGLDERYHSVNGAVRESVHVFLHAGLHHCEKDTVNILEVGFGTGLNAFLTLLDIKNTSRKIYYTGLELYPLPESIIEKLNYPEKYSAQDKALYTKLHDAEWNKEVEISPDFYLSKIECDFTQFDFASLHTTYDLIYFDAFAPDKQPEMWTQKIFDSLHSVTGRDGILVTYCAKGAVRRMMQQAGYKTERLPGPPGKREMLRAISVIGRP
jgi:tRNA U34 5-methylaminomethyl-2-thiouridine-forming methyltransferase MnmC